MATSAYDFVIRQGDTKPALTQTLTDATGTPLNLTGATVAFVMRTLTASSPAISASATVVNAAAGTVSFTFSAGQTATAGQYMATFVVTYGDGSVQTAPADGFLSINIEENLTTSGGNLLVSLAEAKDYLKMKAGAKDDDAGLVRMIRGLGPVVEYIVGPIVQQTVTEWHDGGSETIVLRHVPVVSITSVTEYVGVIPFVLTSVSDPGSATLYCFQPDLPSGRLVRRTAGGGTQAFTSGRQTVKVIYVAGRSSIDANITSGVLELLRINFSQTQRRRPQAGGAPYEADAQEPGREILGFFVPNRVRELLLPSKRPPGLR